MASPSRIANLEVWPELPYKALIDHQVLIETVKGETRPVALTARPVADFYADFISTLSALGIRANFRPIPDEVSDPIPFAEDTVHSTYEPEWANRFWRVLAQADLVLKEHRSHFRGKSSPVHFFWGTFDLAYTRYSGRPNVPPAGAGLIERLGGDAEQALRRILAGTFALPRTCVLRVHVSQTQRPRSAAYRTG